MERRLQADYDEFIVSLKGEERRPTDTDDLNVRRWARVIVFIALFGDFVSRARD
jgi:hypothetical protein